MPVDVAVHYTKERRIEAPSPWMRLELRDPGFHTGNLPHLPLLTGASQDRRQRRANCSSAVRCPESSIPPAWSSSIDHIHSTPGFRPDGWPERRYTLEENPADLERHLDHSQRTLISRGPFWIRRSRRPSSDASTCTAIPAGRPKPRRDPGYEPIAPTLTASFATVCGRGSLRNGP